MDRTRTPMSRRNSFFCTPGNIFYDGMISTHNVGCGTKLHLIKGKYKLHLV